MRCCVEVEVEVAQQALLYAFYTAPAAWGTGQPPSGGVLRAVDAMALCAVLPALRGLRLRELMAAPGGDLPGADAMVRYAAVVAWRGVRVPVVAAPGSDALRGREGALQRVARRGMVLHRAVRRREIWGK